MPIYEFECPIHGRFELIVPLSMHDATEEGTFCIVNDCWEQSEKVWSKPGNIQIGKPTRMFENPRTGEVFPAMSEYQKAPRGFKEVELKSPIERSKFEKEQQRLVDGKNQFISHHLDSLKAESRKNRHDNLEARMNAVQREEDPVTGETVEFTLDHKEKALVKKAMDKSRNKKAREKKSNVMLAVNHTDSSNLDQLK